MQFNQERVDELVPRKETTVKQKLMDKINALGADSSTSVKDLTSGEFMPVIDDSSIARKGAIKKLVLCSGKIYFDLYEARENNKIEDCAIIRLEQFHPFPKSQLQKILNQYESAEELIWVQEEPRNQGAWSYLLSRRHLGGCFDESKPLKCVARPYSSSPAVGYLSLHQEQQQRIIADALGLNKVTEITRKRA